MEIKHEHVTSTFPRMMPYMWRVPFRYDSINGIVKTSEPGAIHTAIGGRPGYDGFIGLDIPQDGLERGSQGYTPGMAWFNAPSQEENAAVQKALSKNWPEAAQPFKPPIFADDEWDDEYAPEYDRGPTGNMYLGHGWSYIEPAWRESAVTPPTVHHVDYDVEGVGDWYHSSDHPFIYMPQTNEVVVGPMGAYHIHMFERWDDPRSDSYGSMYMRNIGRPEFGIGGRVNENKLRWSGGTHHLDDETKNLVERTVRKHLDFPEVPQEPEEREDWSEPSDPEEPERSSWHSTSSESYRDTFNRIMASLRAGNR